MLRFWLDLDASNLNIVTFSQASLDVLVKIILNEGCYVLSFITLSRLHYNVRINTNSVSIYLRFLHVLPLRLPGTAPRAFMVRNLTLHQRWLIMKIRSGVDLAQRHFNN